MHFVYILFSAKVAKYYVGESAFPDSRLIEHNTGKYKQAMTKIATDWVILHLIACTCRTDALKIEKYIKSMKSKKFIENSLQTFPSGCGLKKKCSKNSLL